MSGNQAVQLLDRPLAALCGALDSGEVSARQLVEESLRRIEDPTGEGSRSFLAVAAERAVSEADDIDGRRRSGESVSPLAGVPVAVKDLFDVTGEVSTAGSRVLQDGPAAGTDAAAVARLRAAGMIVVGRTNMTEFAYSGLGLNPHFDTPRSVWRRDRQHIPGGSSSGSAVAVADAQVTVALGTDTGGSCRIPAAFSNIVGYKPTARLVPLDGVIPLAKSLDSVGPLAAHVSTCRAIHRLLCGDSATAVASMLANGSGESPVWADIRLGVLTDVVLDGLDAVVQERFEAALSHLAAAGVKLVERGLGQLNELGTYSANGGLAAAEAYAWHRDLLATKGDHYDRLVRTRIEPGAAVTDSDLDAIVAYRQRLTESFEEASDDVDAWILPTVAITPPTFQQFADGDDEYYRQTNLMALRNTAIGNMLDACAISLPLCQHAERHSAPPVGLMVMAPGLRDDKLLASAQSLEPLCRNVG